MRIKHKFADGFSGVGIIGYPTFINLIHIDGCLLEGDICIYCGFKINLEIENIFKDTSSIRKFKNSLNESYPCLTEEEFIIKGLLE